MSTVQDKIIARINKETEIFWGLRDLSHKIGIHESYIIRLRNWKTKLSLNMINKFSDYFWII